MVFARTIPSSGWKFSNSARVIASPPTLFASALALSSSWKKKKLRILEEIGPSIKLTKAVATSNYMEKEMERTDLSKTIVPLHFASNQYLRSISSKRKAVFRFSHDS